MTALLLPRSALTGLALALGMSSAACGSSSSGDAPNGGADSGTETGHDGGSGGGGSGAGGNVAGSGGAGGNGAGGNGAAGAAGSGGQGGAGGSTTGDAGASGCDPKGYYGAPGQTFTLPTSNGGIYYPDVQASFPDVDWAAINRLYVPAGKYKEFNLGNLPKRDKAHPLVITNKGGQVQVGPNLGANYIWSMGGGSNWILTGRYDEDSATGDAAFVGHSCGAYADSRGKYGFLSDDGFDLTAPYLHMGVSVASATDFAIEFVEVTRSGFAGIRLLNSRAAGDAAFDMANVRINDNYIHDTNGEGTYFGWTGDPPANLLAGLKIYNNRIVRTGNEALQIQDLGDGTEVYNNVIAFASMHWRDNGLGKYQDNNSQVQTRSGAISVHHNVFIGGGGTLLSFWTQPETGDGERHVMFANNYFAYTRSLVAYLGGSAGTGSDFHFTGNYFGGIVFSYDKLDPMATAPRVVFQISPDIQGPVTFANNTWEGSDELVSGLTGGNGTSGVVTGTSNVNKTVTPIVFRNSGYPDGKPVQSLEAWAAKATVNPDAPDITYEPGDLVMDNAEMYECIATNTNQKPSEHAESWMKLPLPADDLRADVASSYAGVGVQ